MARWSLNPIIVCGVLFLLNAESVKAATVSANSCLQADVSAAVGRAANGDTVFIPAGTCTWTVNLSISNKYLTLQGAGIDTTIIIDNVNKSGYPIVPQALLWDTIPGGLTRVTGITWQGGTTIDAGPNKGTIRFQGQSHTVRVDHCKFVPTKTTAMFFYGGVRGVVDHNYFNLSAANGFALYNQNSDGDVPGSDFGDYSWSAADSLGGNQALFLEDNTFYNDQSHNYFWVAHDGWGGSRTVIRHNTFYNVEVANHGTESGGRWRGAREFEIYNNTVSWNMMLYGRDGWADLRSGVGVIFNNTLTITNPPNGLGSVAILKTFRTFDPYAPWGKCDGTSPWDGNTSPQGYPCLDQIGWAGGDLIRGVTPSNTVLGGARWPRQVIKGVYIWNNTVNGAISDAVSQQPTYTKAGREFFNRTPKPGYVPFTYPHPLTTGTANSAPSAPQNLTVS